MTVVVVCVAVTMAEAVTVPVEQHKPDNVDNEARNTNVKHPVSVFYLVHVSQSLDRFHKDRETQSYQEDGVDEGTQHLGPSPAIRVLVGIHLGYLSTRTTSHSQQSLRNSTVCHELNLLTKTTTLLRTTCHLSEDINKESQIEVQYEICIGLQLLRYISRSEGRHTAVTAGGV